MFTSKGAFLAAVMALLIAPIVIATLTFNAEARPSVDVSALHDALLGKAAHVRAKIEAQTQASQDLVAKWESEVHESNELTLQLEEDIEAEFGN